MRPATERRAKSVRIVEIRRIELPSATTASVLFAGRELLAGAHTTTSRAAR
jgi:hypothetical protein